MRTKKSGYVLPVAIGVLVLASLGLLFFSSWSASKVNSPTDDNEIVVPGTQDNVPARSTANDDAALDDDGANIDAQIKALEDNDADINSSLNDTSSL